MVEEALHDTITKYRAVADAAEEMSALEANLNPTGIIESFDRKNQLSDESQIGTPIHQITIGPMGTQDKVKQLQEPPKERMLVVGIGKGGEIIVVCPSQESATSNGWHERCKLHAVNAMGDNLAAVVEGRVYGDYSRERQPGEKVPHHVSIFKRNPNDNVSMHIGGISPKEEGFLYPERYVNSIIAQRILRTLNADRLDVKYADPSLGRKLTT